MFKKIMYGIGALSLVIIINVWSAKKDAVLMQHFDECQKEVVKLYPDPNDTEDRVNYMKNYC